MSHYSTIGDTISCDTPYSAIGIRRIFVFAMPPLLGLSLDCRYFSCRGSVPGRGVLNLKGDILKWDFAVKFPLDKSLLTAPSQAVPIPSLQGLCLDCDRPFLLKEVGV